LAAFFEISISFIAVLVWCAFYVFVCKGSSAAAPLSAISAIIGFFSVFACINMVVLGGYIFYALTLLLVGYLLYKRKAIFANVKNCAKEFFSFGMVFFIVASLAIITIFAVRKPIFMEWDEFSFWGMAPKLIKETGQMYSVFSSEMRAITFTPGLVMLGVFFQFIGTSFVQWKIIAAYNILFFAAFSAVLSALKRKNWATAVPVAVLCFLIPYLLTTYYRVIHVSLPYLFTYADIPLGVMLGGALALYFSAEEKTAKVMVPVLLAITAVALLKDTGFVLALVGAGIITVDLILCEKEKGFKALFSKLPQKLAWVVALFAGPLATFFGWAWHMSTFMGLNRMEVGGAQNMGAVQIVTTGLKELLSWSNLKVFSSEMKFAWNSAWQGAQGHLTTIGSSEVYTVNFGRMVKTPEDFVSVMTNMYKAFFEDALNMFGFRVPGMRTATGEVLAIPGSGAVVVLVILGILAMAFLAADKKQKVRVAWFTFFSTAGFLAYQFFIGLTYVYVFNSFQAEALADYNRYIYPSYIAWMLAALALLAVALKSKPQKHIGNAFLLALATVCFWRFQTYVQPQLSVINVPESYYQGMRTLGEQTEYVRDLLPEDSKLFFVCQDNDGSAWFQRYFYYFPANMDYSFGGGSISSSRLITLLALDETYSEEMIEYFVGKTLTAEVLCEYLAYEGCDYIFIDNINAEFIADYAHLFTDDLQGYRSGETCLYKIETSADGSMYFTPFEMEMTLW